MSLSSDWPDDPESAVAIQRRLRHLVRIGERAVNPGSAVGVDVSYATGSDELVAAAVRIDLRDHQVLESVTVTGRARFGYHPGLLAFREVPIIMDALERLRGPVELVVCDGHGFAHPRRFGLACHLGVLIDVPTIGVAKNPPQFRIIQPQNSRGAFTLIYDGDDVVGCALRTQPEVKPVYVSIGHDIGLDEAREVTLGLAPRYRLPQTTRAADALSRRILADGPVRLD